jgi:MFS transporter, FSR family, fosmidomycin resistance protein
LNTAPAGSLRHDARVIGLVGVAHGISHFFQLALPPLFPLLKAEFDVPFAALGLLMGVYYAASGLTQFAAGIVVDRIGARGVLLGGLAMVAGGTLLAGMVPGLLWLYPLAAVMGVGNGVFHPADFAILNTHVAARRLGYAYSMHGIGGNLGYALAPVVSYTLGAAFGWRSALAMMGVIGIFALGAMATQRAFLTSPRSHDAHLATFRGSLALFAQAPIALCFAYFVIQTAAGTGLQTFAPAALNTGMGVPLAIATSAVTAYLLGSTAGIFAGGFLAARSTRHDRVAVTGIASGALLIGSIATGIATPSLLLALFAAAGFAVGMTGPSRDLIVRKATPAGASGRVYGFVYSGIDLGAMLGPVWFGFMLDHALGRQMFFVVAALLVAAIATVTQVRRTMVPRAA